MNGSHQTERRLTSMLARFAADDAAQDLIEYALLTAFIGVAGAAVFSLLASHLGLAYGSWDTGSQGLWAPPDPAGP